MIKVLTRDSEYEITPTVFPDKTSQVWKTGIPKANKYLIYWKFENESEFMHLNQLNWLLRMQGIDNCKISLFVPFMPYGRQDKEVTDDTTFALKPFLELLSNLFFDNIYTLDQHSTNLNEICSITNLKPYSCWSQKISQNSHLKLTGEEGLIVFPDLGARKRYENDLQSTINKTHFEKVRDSRTGQITHLEPWDKELLARAKHVLVLDDLCDGGATFIKLLEYLPNKTVDLFVTHGIFSKGQQVLKDAGYRFIMTANYDIYLYKIHEHMFGLEK